MRLCTALALVLLTLAGCRTSTAGPPIVVLVSLDGWRWDYLDRVKAPALRQLAARGVRSDGLIPVFPALTFPNHHTLVTGLRPARHGIVSNGMLDPAVPGRFTLSDTSVTGNPAWWGGEPIWNAVTRQGGRSATMFWPGSDVAIGGRRPTYWRLFDHALPAADRTDQVLAWLGLPEQERPSLITLYYSDVDTAGHDFGPESPELAEAAARLDAELSRLVAGADALGLGSRIHWVVVSDHGMAPVAHDRVIILDDLVDLSTIDPVYMGAVLMLNPRGVELDTIDRALRGRHPHLRVYRQSELPPRFALAGHPRNTALVALADEGWVVATRERAARRDRSRDWGGEHGFDPGLRVMHGVFVAAGPRLTPGLTVPAFEAVHVYPLLCELLDLEPADHDGDPAVTRGWLR